MTYLTDEIEPFPLIYKLIQANILRITDLDILIKEKTTPATTLALLVMLTRRGPNAFDQLLEALNHTGQDYIATTLTEAVLQRKLALHIIPETLVPSQDTVDSKSCTEEGSTVTKPIENTTPGEEKTVVLI